MFLPREATFAFAVALVGMSSVARAQQPPPVVVSPENDRAARDHFNLGRASFSQGDFATAAREFSQAYELSRRPQLLYNIGTSYERLHNWEEANLALTRYLELVPDASDRAEVQARINVIQVELAHQAEARQVQAQTATQTTTRVVVIERQVEEPTRYWRIGFFVAGGLTAVAAAGTLGVGLLADSRYNDLARNCGQTAAGCAPDDIDDMRLRQTIVNVGIATTSVLAAATIGCFLLDRFRPQRPPVGPLPPAGAQGPTASAGFVPLAGGGLLTVGGTL
mgnify:CR=1 FL=1